MGLFCEFGFNCVSFGVQDFDMEVQKVVNCMQILEEICIIVEVVCILQYCLINFDLIYGLLKQMLDSFVCMVDEVIVLQLDCFLVFNYVYLFECFMLQWWINVDDLLSLGQKLEMFQCIIE